MAIQPTRSLPAKPISFPNRYNSPRWSTPTWTPLPALQRLVALQLPRPGSVGEAGAAGLHAARTLASKHTHLQPPPLNSGDLLGRSVSSFDTVAPTVFYNPNTNAFGGIDRITSPRCPTAVRQLAPCCGHDTWWSALAAHGSATLFIGTFTCLMREAETRCCAHTHRRARGRGSVTGSADRPSTCADADVPQSSSLS